MTPDALGKLRGRLSDCDVLIYADLHSRTVLSTDGAVRHPQEQLDALCHAAADLFAASEGTRSDGLPHIFFLSPTGGRAFFRNTKEPSEALCCIFGPDADVDTLFREIRAALPGEGAGS